MNTEEKIASELQKSFAGQAAEVLAKHFDVKCPSVKFVNGKTGKYLASRRLIHIGIYAESWFGVEAVLLHEFAHHLEFCRNGGEWAERKVFHGPAFVRALVDIVTFWYENPADYPWEREYKSVQRIYKQRHLDKAA